MLMHSALNLPYTTDAILMCVSIVAGIVDTIAGGGGIVTLPALLFFNVPPIYALSANRFQGLVGESVATYHFKRKANLSLNYILYPIMFALIGSSVGTLLVQHLHNQTLQIVVPLMLLFALSYFLLSGRLFKQSSKTLMKPMRFALIFGLAIGFYNGFFGPGTGSFWVLVFFLFQGLSLKDATVHGKPVNLAGNIASFIFFFSQGHIYWLIALSMAFGQIIGASVGARLVIHNGQKIIRPILTVVVLLMIAELIARSLG